MSDESRFNDAIERFDAANARDPNRTGGLPAELVYAQRMTRWLEILYPNASEALKLAARSQHLRRWEIPRKNYPMNRIGYHKWRTTLYSFHADAAAEILKSAGYDQPTIDRVRQMLRKEKLKTDPEVQALEDVACLVFLENYFADFAPRYDEAKVIAILRKTWTKMSPHAHEAALTIELPDSARELVEKALSS